MNDILSEDRMRVQIGDPYIGLAESKLENIIKIGINDTDTIVSSVTSTNILIDDSRNCSENKIIAWYRDRTPTEVTHEYLFAENNEQVVLRVVGPHLVTETRDSSSAATFKGSGCTITIEHTENFSAASIYCDCIQSGEQRDSDKTGYCHLGLTENFEVVSANSTSARDNPIDDIIDNATKYKDSERGLVCDDSYSDGSYNAKCGLFVKYGTEANVNNNGDLTEHCFVDCVGSEDYAPGGIYFLYIPCGHYTHAKGFERNNQPNLIKHHAFVGLYKLRGLWIDGGSISTSHFSRSDSDGGDPFPNSHDSLEIVYFPSGGNWDNYFTKDTFPNLTFINGTPA